MGLTWWVKDGEGLRQASPRLTLKGGRDDRPALLFGMTGHSALPQMPLCTRFATVFKHSVHGGCDSSGLDTNYPPPPPN